MARIVLCMISDKADGSEKSRVETLISLGIDQSAGSIDNRSNIGQGAIFRARILDRISRASSEQAQPLSSDKTFENDVPETQLKLDQSQSGSRGSVLDSGQDYSRLKLYLHNLQGSDECQLFSAKGCFGEYWL